MYIGSDYPSPFVEAPHSSFQEKRFSFQFCFVMAKEGGVAEDEMVRWHHRLNGHELEQTPGDSDGQESLACCSPWGRKESDTTERLN